MLRGIRVPAPATDRVDAEPMEVKEPAAQQGGKGEPIVMGR
jgi:hypothetical protein